MQWHQLLLSNLHKYGLKTKFIQENIYSRCPGGILIHDGMVPRKLCRNRYGLETKCTYTDQDFELILALIGANWGEGSYVTYSHCLKKPETWNHVILPKAAMGASIYHNTTKLSHLSILPAFTTSILNSMRQEYDIIMTSPLTSNSLLLSARGF